MNFELTVVLDFPRYISILDYPNIQLIRTAVPEFHSELIG